MLNAKYITQNSHIFAATFLILSSGMPQAEAATSAPIIGEIQFMTVQNPGAPFSRGVIVVGGQNIIVPSNLLIDLPANRLTLQQLFAEASPDCLALGESGLAKGDQCNNVNRRTGAIATILANRTNAGDVIAGEVVIAKGVDAVTGVVTFIDHTDGYFRLNGNPNDATTGVMVRINDPDGRHTIQQGAGCLVGSANCSPDPRFTGDSDNYTFTFSSGYPACIASTVVGGARVSGSDAQGRGDAFCPDTNRAGSPVANSFRFAPVQLGDSLAAEGNMEIVNGVQFLSAHTVNVNGRLLTEPGQPDYLIFAETEWDTAGFQNERVRMLMIGFTTLPSSLLDVFASHHDRTNVSHEFLIGSTVGNPNTVNQGIGANAGGIFKIRYDIDFLSGVIPEGSPCLNLQRAGFSQAQSGCSPNGTLNIGENFRKVVPIAREIIARTRNKVDNAIGDSQDIRGNAAPNGEYLTPVGIGHPEFVEIDLARLNTPFIFEGQPWNLDRRVGPNGCIGPCPATAQPLTPFPFSGLNPAGQAQGIPAGALARILAVFPFNAGNRVPYPSIDPPAQGIIPTPVFPAPTLGPLALGSATLPLANKDSAKTMRGMPVAIDLLSNDQLGASSGNARIEIVSRPSHGSVELTSGGFAIYKPMTGFSGEDSFKYVMKVGESLSNEGTVSIHIENRSTLVNPRSLASRVMN